ncbi:hypothetical protein Tco_0928800 [Tanacetum coccineum]
MIRVSASKTFPITFAVLVISASLECLFVIPWLSHEPTSSLEELLEVFNRYSVLFVFTFGRAAFGLCPYHFTYPERKLAMKEILYRFIDEGKREHEEIRAFICDFQTTNEILFKERNNSLIELRFGVQDLLKVIMNTPIIDCKVKGVTTRGGNTTTQDDQNNDTNVHTEEPLAVNHDEPVESNEVLTNNQPQKTNEPDAQPSNKIQTPPIPFPQRLRREKEEAQ